jgi:hypothetical protein
MGLRNPGKRGHTMRIFVTGVSFGGKTTMEEAR